MQRGDNLPPRARLALPGAAVAVGRCRAAAIAARRRVRSFGSTWTSRRSTTPMDQIVYAPNRETGHSSVGSPTASAARAAIGAARRRVAYGATEIEKLDIYSRQGKRHAPVNIFVHGGAWRANSGRRLFLPRRAVRAPQVRISSSSTSPMWRRPGGSLFPHGQAGAPRRCLGLQEWPAPSVAMRRDFISPRIPPARISAGAW